MNTREHINSLKELISCKGFTLKISQETVNTLKELITLIQRGKRFEKIVKELEKITTGEDIYARWLLSDIKRIKEKYFPKEK